MPARVYKSNREQMLAEGQMIVSSTDDAKYQHKVEMVNIVLGGMPPSQLSEFVSESKNTITMWVKIADEQGFEALKAKKQPGRPMKLSADNIAAIKAILEESDPGKYGYNVWDGPSLSAYIKATYNVDLCVRQCQRMFRNLGMSLIRPQTFPSKNKEGLDQERESFKKTDRIVERPIQSSGLPGRSPFPGYDISNQDVGTQGFETQGGIHPGKGKCTIQRLCCPRYWGTHHDKAVLVQL